MASSRVLRMTPELHEYVVAHSSGPDEVQADLIAETAAALPDHASMQIGPDQGVLLTLLTRLSGGRNVVEVGTFTGYSALCIARGLAPGGRLVCCDVSEEWTSIARRYWERAGVADRVDLRIAPALETLAALPAEPAIDLAFIDADKGSYVAYWDELVPRVRPGGLLLVDNTLWSGRVADAPDASGRVDETIRDITAFNDHVVRDGRVETTILSIGDGLTVAQKL